MPKDKKAEVVDIQRYGIWIDVREGYSEHTTVLADLCINYPALSFRVELPIKVLMEAAERVKWVREESK